MEGHDLEKVFDAFAKAVMRNEARNMQRQRKRRSSKEILFCELNPFTAENLTVQSNTFPAVFNTDDFTIEVYNDKLALALDELGQLRQRIILLSYFAGFSDSEIAKMTGQKRGCVQYQRTRALDDLRRFLSEDHT